MSKTGPALGKDGPFPMIEGLDPEIMKFTTLYQGPGGPRTSTHAVVHSKNQLTSILPNAVALGIDPNQIDFENEEAIIVGLGQRPTSGYRIEIKSVVYCTDRGGTLPALTLVNYSEETPGGTAQDVLTFPVHVIKLKNLTGAIQFNKT